MNLRSNVPLALVFACATSLLIGCAANFGPALTTNTSATLGTIKGNVHGGQQPVSGSHVYVMEVANNGYGAASRSLITSNFAGTDTVGNYVLTDAGGGFGVSNDYTCDSGSQVYILSEQGNPGLSAGTNNTAIALMALLGACPGTGTLAGTVPFVAVNEVSTVAMAYALAGFAVDATHIGSSGTALAVTGLNNAAALVPNIVPTATASALTVTAATGSTGVVPQAELNTLGNILASCINAANSSSGGCPTLFANATADGTSGGTQPTDTATAAINIAHHPAQGAVALCGLQSANSPFQPQLACSSTSPNDFTMQIVFKGNGLQFPWQPAIDGAGNIWVPSNGNNTLEKFSPLGVPLSGAGGFSGGGLNAPSQVAIDAAGNAWVANAMGNSISEFNSSGTSQAGAGGFTGNNDVQANSIAIDRTGYVWVTNPQLGTVSKISSSGAEVLNTTDGPEFDGPNGIAIDASNNVWVADPPDNEIDILNNTTGLDAVIASGSATGEIVGGGNPTFLQLSAGASPTAWATQGRTYISSQTNTGRNSFVVEMGGGLSDSSRNALDGAGNIWVTNQNGSISEFSSAGTAITPGTGYTTVLAATFGIAVDGSGNVWVTSYDNTASNPQLAEFVGAATPTVTPLVQAVINNNIAGKP